MKKFYMCMFYYIFFLISFAGLSAGIEFQGIDSALFIDYGAKIHAAKPLRIASGSLQYRHRHDNLSGSNIYFYDTRITDNNGSYTLEKAQIDLTESSDDSIALQGIQGSIKGMSLHTDLSIKKMTFTENTRINANGHIIDFAAENGYFEVADGVLVFIEDAIIQGVQGDSSTGSLRMASDSSTIILVNCSVSLAGNTTTTAGVIAIYSSVTFNLFTYDWLFTEGMSTQGTLNIQGNLWIDAFNMDPMVDVGSLQCPNPLFVAREYAASNVQSNITFGSLVMSDSAIVREVGSGVSSGGSGGGGGETGGLEGTITTTLALTNNKIIKADEQLTLNGGTALSPLDVDGHGASITFTHAVDDDGNPIPQFIVSRDSVVRLHDVTLSQINSHSLEIKGGGTLLIGENVDFELAEDVVFDGQEQNQSTSPDRLPGKIVLDGDDIVFTLRSKGSRKKFAVKLPDSPTYYIDNGKTIQRDSSRYNKNDGVPDSLRLFSLGANKLVLDNVEFSGLGYIDFNDRPITKSSVITRTDSDTVVTLAGHASFEVDRDTKINFVIDGLGNELLFKKEGIALYGTVNFLGDAARSTLHIRHMLNDSQSYIESGLVKQRGGEYNPLRIYLKNESCISLNGANESDRNIMGIIFDDPYVELINENENSFLLGSNSFIRGNNLRVSQYPIKQMSSFVDIEGLSVLHGMIDATYLRSSQLLDAKNSSNKKDSRALPYPLERYVLPDFSDMVVAMHRDNIPVSYSDKRRFIRCVVNDFSVDQGETFALLLDGTTLHQAVGKNMYFVGTRFDTNEVIIKGLNNVINVNGKVYIGKDTLKFDQNEPTSLTFNFLGNSENSQVIIQQGTILTIPANGVLEFKGRGQVILEDDAQIILGGKATKVIDDRKVEKIKKITDRARLSLSDGAALVLENPRVYKNNQSIITQVVIPKAYISGIGTVSVGRGASIGVNDVGSLIIAPYALSLKYNSTSKVKEIDQIPDDILFYISSSADLRAGILWPDNAIKTYLDNQVDDEVLQAEEIKARILIGAGNTDWNFDHDAKISIRRNGRFEFNNAGYPPNRLLDGTTLTKGFIRSLNFSGNAMIYIAEDGSLVLGQNQGTNEEKSFLCDFDPAKIVGAGSVELVSSLGSGDTYKGFIGKLQNLENSSLVDASMTMLSLAKKLVSVNKNLSVACEYIDAQDGKRKVRTRLGINVQLQDGDVLLSENTDVLDSNNFGKIFGKNGTTNFVINANGLRS